MSGQQRLGETSRVAMAARKLLLGTLNWGSAGSWWSGKTTGLEKQSYYTAVYSSGFRVHFWAYIRMDGTKGAFHSVG